MKSIGEALAGRAEAPKKKGPNHERAAVVEELVAFMGEQNDRMPYWLGRTRKLSPSRIYQLISKAKEGKKPRALFQHLLSAEIVKLKNNG